MKNFVLMTVAVLLTFTGLQAAAPPESAFRVIDPPPRPGRQITPYLRYQVEAAWRQDEVRKTRLAAIHNESDLLEFQRETRSNLLEIIGGLPESKTPLNPQITGRIVHILCPQEGRFAIVTDVGRRMRWTR